MNPVFWNLTGKFILRFLLSRDGIRETDYGKIFGDYSQSDEKSFSKKFCSSIRHGGKEDESIAKASFIEKLHCLTGRQN